MKLFRIGYNARTRRAKGWASASVKDCEVVALFAPGLSVCRMAGSLRKLADELQTLPDPNKSEPAPPVVRYTGTEEVQPAPRIERKRPAL